MRRAPRRVRAHARARASRVPVGPRAAAQVARKMAVVALQPEDQLLVDRGASSGEDYDVRSGASVASADRPVHKKRRGRVRTRTVTASSGTQPALLQDPLGDRAVKYVPRPAAQLLTHESLFGEGGEWNWTAGNHQRMLQVIKQHLEAEGLLSQELILELIAKAKDIFQEEPNLLKLDDPVNVVGDIHGQYFDIASIMGFGAKAADPQYLFLGDYVDRGSFSMEVVVYLFSLKISKPRRIFMLRGNHESRQMTSYFNFAQECEFKYDRTVYEAIMECFDTLPIAAVINKQFLAVHGGLSPSCVKLRDIDRVDRIREPPEDGLVCDLLWSDPAPSAKAPQEWARNTARGCAWWFSANAAQRFLKENSLLCVIRAHEVQLQGFKVHETNPRTGFPSMITVFSAPNYCDTYGNQGAVLQLNNSTLNVMQYNFNDHPFHLPEFMGVFEWSAPYLAEKVLAVFQAVLSAGGRESDSAVPGVAMTARPSRRESLSAEQNEVIDLVAKLARHSVVVASDAPDDTDEASRARIKKKAWLLAMMARACRDKVNEYKHLIECHVCPGDGLDAGKILKARERVKSEADLFNVSVELDADNEKRPLGEERERASSLHDRAAPPK